MTLVPTARSRQLLAEAARLRRSAAYYRNKASRLSGAPSFAQAAWDRAERTAKAAAGLRLSSYAHMDA